MSQGKGFSRFGTVIRNLIASTELKQPGGYPISQNWLAGMTNIPPSSLSAMIYGRMRPTQQEVERISNVLRLTERQRTDLLQSIRPVLNVNVEGADEPVDGSVGVLGPRLGENLTDEELEDMTLMGADELISQMAGEGVSPTDSEPQILDEEVGLKYVPDHGDEWVEESVIDEQGDLKVIPGYPEDTSDEAGEEVADRYPPLEKHEVVNLAGALLSLHDERSYRDVGSSGFAQSDGYKLYQRMVANGQWSEVLRIVGLILRRTAQDEIKFFELGALEDPVEAAEFLATLDHAWYEFFAVRK